MKKQKEQKRLGKSIITVIIILVMIGNLQILWGSYILRYYKKQNEQLEYNVTKIFLTDKDITFSYLYSEMQQMAYDGTQLKQIENAFVNEENTDDYTKNNAIISVKNAFGQLVDTVGGSMNFFYYNPKLEMMVEYGSSSINARKEFTNMVQEDLKDETIRLSKAGRWYIYNEKYICQIVKGKQGYIGSYMLVEDFVEQLMKMFAAKNVTVELYDSQNNISYIAEGKGSKVDKIYAIEGENEGSNWRSMNYAEFPVRVELQDKGLTTPLIAQGMFTLVFMIFLVGTVFVIQYTRKNILGQAKYFYDNLLLFSDQMKFQEESGIVEFAEAGKVLNMLADKINKLKIDIYEEQLEKKKVELDYAQLQIRPHFYINCLNVIYSLAQIGEIEQIQKISLCVSKYLRYIFHKSLEPVNVAEEIGFVKNYLQVIDNVNGVECKLEMEVEEGLEQFPVPPLMIQTFIENSVVHGMNIEELFCVSVRVESWKEEEKDYVKITIADSGKGIPKEVRDQWNQGQFETEDVCYHVGVRNAAKRMQMLYGENAKLQFEEREEGGTQVVMLFPKSFGEEIDENIAGR